LEPLFKQDLSRKTAKSLRESQFVMAILFRLWNQTTISCELHPLEIGEGINLFIATQFVVAMLITQISTLSTSATSAVIPRESIVGTSHSTIQKRYLPDSSIPPAPS
jgi:hypothetical protein